MTLGFNTVRRLTTVALAVVIVFALAETPRARAQDPIADFFNEIFGGNPHIRSRPAPRGGGGDRVRRIAPHQTYRRSAPVWRDAAKPVKRKPSAPIASGVSRDASGVTRDASGVSRDASGVSTDASGVSTDARAAAQEKPVEASFFVAVLGDTLGQLLSGGLGEAFEDKAEIAVRNLGKESSGLVRTDYYDWPKAARDIAAGTKKIDVAIIMVGSNDRQAIADGAASHEALSTRWRELYAQRVDAVIAAFKEKNVPLVWVGLPVMKSERFSADMAQLNGIYRERAARGGAAYVDVFEVFGDEHNSYEAFGPDVNGQIVKLRAADGVHFTGAGARKLAHFVEVEVKRVFDARRPAAPAPDQPAATAPTHEPSASAAPGDAAPGSATAPVVFTPPVGPPSPAAPTLPERPAIGPAQSLLTTAPEDELARPAKPAQPTDASAAAARALADHVLVQGGEPPARPNRADDFTYRAADAPGPVAH
jgi:hypothetical protein